MNTHAKTSASQNQPRTAMPMHPKTNAPGKLYLDRKGNAALEVGDRLIVVLGGSFAQTRLAFKESQGPLWQNRHATVRLDSRGDLNVQAGANRLVLHPVSSRQRIVGVVHGDKPLAFSNNLDAVLESHRTGRHVTWHSLSDLQDGVQLVAPLQA